jgi:protein-S-isoprenylcysteine O-methyltransferase Ste14
MRALLGTVLFTLLVPGSVAFWIPSWLLGHWPLGGWDVSSIPALCLIAAGIAVYLWCAVDFVRRGHGTPAPIVAPRSLVVTGPYLWVRNPMYVAVLAILLGEALWTRSLKLTGYGVIVGLLFQAFVVLHEERALLSRFGEQYEDYRRAVPRWLP